MPSSSYELNCPKSQLRYFRAYPAFYSYAYPTPEGFKDAAVQPETAFFHEGLEEFVSPYEAVREAADPD